MRVKQSTLGFTSIEQSTSCVQSERPQFCSIIFVSFPLFAQASSIFKANRGQYQFNGVTSAESMLVFFHYGSLVPQVPCVAYYWLQLRIKSVKTIYFCSRSFILKLKKQEVLCCFTKVTLHKLRSMIRSSLRYGSHTAANFFQKYTTYSPQVHQPLVFSPRDHDSRTMCVCELISCNETQRNTNNNTRCVFAERTTFAFQTLLLNTSIDFERSENTCASVCVCASDHVRLDHGFLALCSNTH